MEKAKVSPMTEEAEEIDAGFRHWYESCPCCLSQAYPDVKQALDEQQAARSAQQYTQPA